MERLLCIVSCLNTGGAETFLMKIYRKFERTKFQMDFCVMSKEIGFYEEEVQALGGRIYHIVPKTEKMIKSFFTIKNIVKQNNYDYVIRINEHSLSVIDLIAAKLGGAKNLTLRSTNANTGSKKRHILHKLFQFLPQNIPTVKIAPSTEAAEYNFGKRQVEKGKVHILNNGIPIEKFLFSEEKRLLKRKELGLEDNFVVGHVGRFMTQKNHMYLLDIFKSIKNRIPNAVLVLVGDGELRKSVEKRAKELEIEEAVRFLGVRADVPELFMAMDIKIFPSFFEGMPNTVIEAQGTGLPCIISDTITREADITGLVTYMSIEDSPEEWAEKCVDIKKQYRQRKNTREDFVKAQYDIDSVVKNFMELVF